MNDNLIYTKSFLPPEIDRREILRYAGVRESTPEIDKALDECINEALEILSYNVCYRIYNIKVEMREVDLGFSKVASQSLIKALDGCSLAVAFCATVGVGIDRLIAKYNALSPAKAVLMQALGSERVEALCEVFCLEIQSEAENKEQKCTKRFSPGYGDLPLDIQRDIFSSLNCTGRIGVNLGENLFMTPTKSVTAIFGIKM